MSLLQRESLVDRSYMYLRVFAPFVISFIMLHGDVISAHRFVDRLTGIVGGRACMQVGGCHHLRDGDGQAGAHRISVEQTQKTHQSEDPSLRNVHACKVANDIYMLRNWLLIVDDFYKIF